MLYTLQREVAASADWPSETTLEQALQQITELNELTSRNNRLVSWKRLPLASTAGLLRWQSETCKPLNLDHPLMSRPFDSAAVTLISGPEASSSQHNIVDNGQGTAINAAASQHAVGASSPVSEAELARVLSRIPSHNRGKYF